MTGAYYQNGHCYTISPTDAAVIEDSTELSAAIPPTTTPVTNPTTTTTTTTTVTTPPVTTPPGTNPSTTVTTIVNPTETSSTTPITAQNTSATVTSPPPPSTTTVAPIATPTTTPPVTTPTHTATQTPPPPAFKPSTTPDDSNVGNTPTAFNANEFNIINVTAGLNQSAGAAMAFFFDGSHLGDDFVKLGSAISSGQGSIGTTKQVITVMKQLLSAYVADPNLATGVSIPGGPTLAIPGQFVIDVVNDGLKAISIGNANLDRGYGGAVSQFFNSLPPVLLTHGS